MSTTTHPNEKLTLPQAAKLVPGRPHASTLWRWCRRGVKARDGVRVRLAHQRYGQRVFVTEAAIERFAAELAEHDADGFDAEDDRKIVTPPKSRTARQRERAIAKAEDELRRDGI